MTPALIIDVILAVGIVTFGVLLIREMVGLCSALWKTLLEALAEDHPRPVWRLRRRARRGSELTRPRRHGTAGQSHAASGPADPVRAGATSTRLQRPNDERIEGASRKIERDRSAIVVPKRVE
jgi:hypothetical protein